MKLWNKKFNFNLNNVFVNNKHNPFAVRVAAPKFEADCALGAIGS